MNKDLLNVIHKYAEYREIDWTSAKVIGEQYGRVFKSEEELREWKSKIDKYLTTFEQKDFQAIEEACKKKAKKKSKQVTEAYNKPQQAKYTKEQLDKLRKKYGVDTNDKALELAIRDKKKGKKDLGKNPKKKEVYESKKKRA